MSADQDLEILRSLITTEEKSLAVQRTLARVCESIRLEKNELSDVIDEEFLRRSFRLIPVANRKRKTIPIGLFTVQSIAGEYVVTRNNNSATFARLQLLIDELTIRGQIISDADLRLLVDLRTKPWDDVI